VPDPTPPSATSASALVAAQHVRLLAATVDIVADGYDPLEGEPFLPVATVTAALALLGLAEGVPEHTEQALADLAGIVARLPVPPAGAGAAPGPFRPPSPAGVPPPAAAGRSVRPSPPR
jgi:hypothetical protein